jgi:hypothetical protein
MTITETRELLFVCEFQSRYERRIGHVRAWDAGEARELFLAELRADGVAAPGDVKVAPVRGRRRAARLEPA